MSKSVAPAEVLQSKTNLEANFSRTLKVRLKFCLTAMQQSKLHRISVCNDDGTVVRNQLPIP